MSLKMTVKGLSVRGNISEVEEEIGKNPRTVSQFLSVLALEWWVAGLKRRRR